MSSEDPTLSLPASPACEAEFAHRGYAGLAALFTDALAAGPGDPEPVARRLARLFNGAAPVLRLLETEARKGDAAAAETRAWMAHHGLDTVPLRPLGLAEAQDLETRLRADPQGYVARADAPYPLIEGARAWGFAPDWVRARLQAGRTRFARFAAERGSDTAVLLGNGPSLARLDLDLLRGQDVYISNYALRHPDLARLARGVAVSNSLVAAQEPWLFQRGPHWRFHPVWLGHILDDGDRTVWLNALGGALFFSDAVLERIAWHATVTFFWLQILYAAGYRRVLLAGVDNSYVQAASAREGDVIEQQGDDANHFDPGYFRGKRWQAADTDHMARTYALARAAFEADGRVLLNCTDGGQLEDLPRMPLSVALGRS